MNNTQGRSCPLGLGFLTPPARQEVTREIRANPVRNALGGGWVGGWLRECPVELKWCWGHTSCILRKSQQKICRKRDTWRQNSLFCNFFVL